MSEPSIFIGTHPIADGKLDEFKRDARELVSVVEREETRLLAFNFYFNQDESEVTVVQVHPDADSMLFHMQVAREHITASTEDQLVTKERRTGTPLSCASPRAVAQLAEHRSPKPGVEGSSPSGPVPCVQPKTRMDSGFSYFLSYTVILRLHLLKWAEIRFRLWRDCGAAVRLPR